MLIIPRLVVVVTLFSRRFFDTFVQQRKINATIGFLYKDCEICKTRLWQRLRYISLNVQIFPGSFYSMSVYELAIEGNLRADDDEIIEAARIMWRLGLSVFAEDSKDSNKKVMVNVRQFNEVFGMAPNAG